ncbi:unnamed protein product [Ectocarpus sp. 8 AP-2014]
MSASAVCCTRDAQHITKQLLSRRTNSHAETMERFNESLEKMKPVDLDKVSNEDKLKLYGLFKQINVGDCDTKRPGMMDMKGKAKWDSWKGMEGKSKDDAMNEYADHVEHILASLA